MKEYFHALDGEKKEEVKAALKEKCVSWIREVATDDEEAELKESFDDGEKDAVKAKVEEYFGRLSPERQAEVDEYCRIMYDCARRIPKILRFSCPIQLCCMHRSEIYKLMH